MSDAELKLIGLVDALLQQSAKCADHAHHDYTEAAIQELERVRCWKSYWTVNVEMNGESNLNRLGNLLGGYPYTSEAYAWPINDHGQPLFPLIQINLDEVNRLANENFGDGLLQVWLDTNDFDLPSLVRVIDEKDLADSITSPSFDSSVFNDVDTWTQVCASFSLAPGGVMCPDFSAYLIESKVGRDLSEDEIDIIDQIAEISDGNDFRNFDEDWLLGFPDKGSGSPANRYDPAPENFFQFKTPKTFSMANVSSYGNLFYERDGDIVSFFFDWNG